MTATPRVSVIVPVLDMADVLGPCLAALTAQSLPAGEREIIVVDNGSSDGSPDVARQYPVTVLEERTPGAPAARNRGLASARGALIAFTDADCVPSRGWLAHLVRAADRSGADVIAGSLAVLDPERSAVARYSAALGQYDAARTLSHPMFPYAPTGNVCVRRSVFDSIGPFNPEFRTFDAAELFWRLAQRAPIQWAFEPRALVFYRTRTSVGAFVSQNFGYGRGTGRLWRRTRSTARGSALAPLRAWPRRLQDGVKVARSAGDGSTYRAVPYLGLHVLREAALTAGFLAAQFEPTR
jgi:glycosyltransferase involved in cell wall biosynthesis